MNTSSISNTPGRKRAQERKNRGRRKLLRRKNGLKLLPAHVTEEDDWRAEGTSVKTSRLFGVMLALHLVGVAGLAAFTIFGRDAEKQKPKASGEPAKVAQLPKPEPTTKPQPVPAVPQVAKTPIANQVASSIPEDAIIHRVRSGEKWETIAAEYDVHLDELMMMNPDAGCIVGERLLIPRKPNFISAQPTEAQLRLERERAAEAQASNFVQPPIVREYSKNENLPRPSNELVEVNPRSATVKKQPKGDVQSATVTEKRELVAKYLTHTVSRGDTAFSISKRYKIPLSQLLRANGLAEASKITRGQKLKIPTQR